LRGFCRGLRLAKAKIRAVATDMSAANWSAVLEHLPHAALVSDEFHILKLMSARLADLRREMVREAEGPLKLEIKGTRFLLLRNPQNLVDDKIPKLEEALRLNEPLLLGWYLKDELRELWNQISRQQMKVFLKD
jgi:transposase